MDMDNWICVYSMLSHISFLFFFLFFCPVKPNKVLIIKTGSTVSPVRVLSQPHVSPHLSPPFLSVNCTVLYSPNKGKRMPQKIFQEKSRKRRVALIHRTTPLAVLLWHPDVLADPPDCPLCTAWSSFLMDSLALIRAGRLIGINRNQKMSFF